MHADLHAHTCFSFDGAPEATVTAMCESALQRGLSHLALTDHCDINGEIEGLYAVLDKEAVFAAIAQAKKNFEGRLTVLFGIELGQATQYPRQAAALLAEYPYDIVLGSLHNLAGAPDFYYMSMRDAKIPAVQFADLSDAAISALFDRVLDESMELLDFDGIHVLTHLTYMHRYVKRAGRDMDFTPFESKLKRLFAKMIQKSVALELNTSSIGAGVPVPTLEILRLYHDCGGRLITVGSDAHHPDRIAAHFNDACRMLTACGFTELAVPTANGTLTFPIQQ